MELLERITTHTGQGRTEAVVHALGRYRAGLVDTAGIEGVIASIRTAVHAHLAPEHKGRAPSNAEIEAELEMP